MGRRRYAIVGAGARAQMFARALVTDHADRAELVAFADVNPVRIEAHNRRLVALGAAPAAAWTPADLADRLVAGEVDTLLVTSVDSTHDEYIVMGLDAGVDVITEKPMTTDVDRCRRILAAADRTGGRVTVTFNYRYNPLHEKVRELLSSGAPRRGFESGGVTPRPLDPPRVSSSALSGMRHVRPNFRAPSISPCAHR